MAVLWLQCWTEQACIKWEQNEVEEASILQAVLHFITLKLAIKHLYQCQMSKSSES